MPTITDKTRKLLWARSGNRCALCGRRLTEAATTLDPAVVVGDECHIVSKAPDGPRHDPFFAADPDGYDNLLLLCSADNRMVDTQLGTYSVEKLKQLKANHEAAVANAVDGHFANPARSPARGAGFDNYRTEILFQPGHLETEFERFQQVLIADRRLRSYGKVGTGFGATAGVRTHAWIQAFLPVSAELVRTLAREAGISVMAIRHELLPGIYNGLIPD